VAKAAVLDVAPLMSKERLAGLTSDAGRFLRLARIRPFAMPRQMIGIDPEYYLRKALADDVAGMSPFAPEALAEYLRCFRNPETIRAFREDYLASYSIDLKDEEIDLGRKVGCPMLVLWARRRALGRSLDVLSLWRERADDATGEFLAGGHYLPEERPDEVAARLAAFFHSA
jgi:haloacetate dehalogenase